MNDYVKIKTLTKKRGRPKINRPHFDTGTPETVMKKLCGITTEVLDLFLECGIINNRQHWCGMHLRWLYTLVYGIPSVRAIELSNFSRQTNPLTELDDIAWREAREKEYNDAIHILNCTGHAALIKNICIFNEKPKFFNILTIKLQNKSAIINQEAQKINEGLNILVKLWKNS